MKQRNLFAYLWLTFVISIFPAFPAYSDEVSIKNIPQLSEIQLPHTSVKELLAQQQNQVIQVIGVRLHQTASGLEIILETTASDKLQVTNKNEGNNFVVDIPNTQLRLPNGNPLRQEKPIAGITELVVINQDANSIRVTVTGEAGIPKVELDDSDEGLIFVVTPVLSSTQQQQSPEISNSTTKTPPTAAQEPIELVVTGEKEGNYNVPNASTATKIEVPLRDIPQSIQVIPRQVIEDRRVVRINELTDNVSGVRPAGGYGGLSSVGFYIRGFSQGNENLRNGFRDFGFISPREVANVEQVEFLKGPGSVLYGSNA